MRADPGPGGMKEVSCYVPTSLRTPSSMGPMVTNSDIKNFADFPDGTVDRNPPAAAGTGAQSLLWEDSTCPWGS